MTRVRRADGKVEMLAGCDQTRMMPGDAVIVTTPTGGGYDQSPYSQESNTIAP
jgi:5-oxoprolinase (ATP-hydrolysing)